MVWKHFLDLSISASESSTVSESSNASSTVKRGKARDDKGKVLKTFSQNTKHSGVFTVQDLELTEGEDTMKDLRTTFAGIFGDKK